jgi:hypothetical protein
VKIDGEPMRPLGFSALTLKTVVVHTTSYFVAGVLAYTLGGYEKTFSQPPLSYLMRPWSITQESGGSIGHWALLSPLW